MKTITEEQYNKLIDCEILQSDYKTWNPAKFYSRGLAQINYALKMKVGDIFIVNTSCSRVRINGVILKYIPRYSFTNPKNPFKT